MESLQKAGREWLRNGGELVRDGGESRDGGELAESWRGAGEEVAESSLRTWGELAD